MNSQPCTPPFPALPVHSAISITRYMRVLDLSDHHLCHPEDSSDCSIKQITVSLSPVMSSCCTEANSSAYAPPSIAVGGQTH